MSAETDPGPPSGGGASAAAAAAMLNQPIVIDCGGRSTKAGFAGGTKPKVVIGTKVGRAKHQRVMPGGALEGEPPRRGGGGAGRSAGGASSYFVGRALDEHRGAFLLEWPVERGRVVDGGWEAMELLWEHLYSKTNLNAKMDEHPVLLTEPPHNPTAHRARLAECFFETFRAPALFVAPPAVLSLYASGRTTGIVLDVGAGVTHCVPVYEGHALPHSIVRSDLAGVDVTERLRALARGSGLRLATTAEADFATTMKEEVCYVAAGGEGTDAARGAGAAAPTARYQLPDGQVVDLGDERHLASEVLFRPSLVGSEEPAVHDVLLTAIRRSDMDLRATLFANAVLAGGTTLLPGFGDRLLREVRARAPERTRIRISAPPERRESAWVGGSILASLATFKDMWVTRSEYEDQGARILQRGAL